MSPVKLLILALNGVVNEERNGALTSPDQWQPIPGSLEAIARANSLGYQIAIATNKPELANGSVSIDALNDLQKQLNSELNVLGGHIDALFFCPHLPEDHCNCRLPKPGLLLDIGARFHVELENVLFFGSSLVDAEAARLVGAEPVLVKTGKQIQALEQQGNLPENIPIFENLASAIEILLPIL